MKALYVFALLFAFFLRQDVMGVPNFKITDELIKATTECSVENNIDLTELEKYKDTEIPKEVTDKHEFKCFTKCLSIKTNVMDSQGNVLIDKLKEVYEPDDKSIFDKMGNCKPDMSITDDCERFAKVNDCIEKLSAN